MHILKPIEHAVLYNNYFTLSAWKPQPHVPRLIDLISSLTGADSSTSILDIGCNDGSFLSSLKDHGFQNCFGIEPTLDSFNSATQRQLSVINLPFSE